MSLKKSLNKLVSTGTKSTVLKPAANFQVKPVSRTNAEPSAVVKSSGDGGGGLVSPVIITILTTVSNDILGDGTIMVEDAVTGVITDAEGTELFFNDVIWP